HMTPSSRGAPPVTTAEHAVAAVRSGERIFIHSVAAAPQRLIAALVGRAADLCDVELVHLHTEGPAPYADPALSRSFRANVVFVGANVRSAVERGDADYVPVFLSEVPALFRTGVMPLDHAFVQL